MALRLIKRERYLAKIRPFYDTKEIKVLTGIHRSGKSVLLRSIAEELGERGIPTENILVINFDCPATASYAYAEGLLEKIRNVARDSHGKLYLFLDAFDRVEDGEKALDLIRVNVECDIFLAMSDKSLSVDNGAYFPTYPFGFEEFAECYRENVGQASLETIFRSFLQTGGMPYVFQLGLDPERVRHYLSDTFKILYVAGIAERYFIRHLDLLERVADYVITHVGTVFSAGDVLRGLKAIRRTTSADTVIQYLRYFCEARLCYRVPREKAGETVGFSSTDTYYLPDHGIREAIRPTSDKEQGAILRNIIFTEAIRRGFDVSVGKNVDFLCVKEVRTIGIRVDDDGRRNKVNDKFPIYTVSPEMPALSGNGIHNRNIIDFLLQDEW